jgi:cellulose synthase/poly-beta-1,6-N-acetylglucosamine synthase-like glycosyltransferase
MTPLLTIMLPTTVDRRPLFEDLLREIIYQIENSGCGNLIQILIDEDNKERSIGRKRQELLELAEGDFVVGIDSDDWIDQNYIVEIMKALQANPDTDHVGFEEECCINGEYSKSIFSIQHCRWDENKYGYDHVRCANPKSVIRRTKALQVGYPDLRYAEDIAFSEAVTPLLTSEVFINKPLYKYRHNSSPHNERYGIE